MVPTGLDIKRNIVRLAQMKGIKQIDFIEAGIGATTVKKIFRLHSSQTPDLDTVNKFAKVLGVETYMLYMNSDFEGSDDPEKEQFKRMIDMTFHKLSDDHRRILMENYRTLLDE